MGPFPHSFENSYILLVVHYVSKWIETVITTSNDTKVVKKFLLKNIFRRYETSRALINDEGMHSINRPLQVCLKNTT